MNHEISNLRAASKSMSRLQISSKNRACDLDVLWCRIMYAKYEKSFTKSHRHIFYEIHFVLNGTGGFLFEQGNRVSMRKGDFILIAPSFGHEYSELSPDFEDFVTGFQVDFHSGNLNGLFLENAFGQVQGYRVCRASERMFQYVYDIQESAYFHHTGVSAIAEAYFQLFLLEAARQLAPNYSFRDPTQKVFEGDSQYEFVKQFISENLSQKLTTADIARQLNISAIQLNRILANTFQTTVSQMMREARFERIRHLLEHTQLSLSQIAEQTGFSNEYNMNRFFRQIEGMPPGAFRKSLQK